MTALRIDLGKTERAMLRGLAERGLYQGQDPAVIAQWILTRRLHEMAESGAYARLRGFDVREVSDLPNWSPQ